MSALGPGVEPWSPDVATGVLAEFRFEHDVLLALQAVQERFGWIPDDAVPMIAAACNVSLADVHGVRTFYRDLRSAPPPDTIVRICMGEACQAVGARSLKTQALTLAVGDPRLEVDDVFCLGNCALGPSATVSGVLIGRATLDALRSAVARTPITGAAP